MQCRVTPITIVNYRLIAVIAFSFILFIFSPGKASAIVNGEETHAGEQPWTVGIAQAAVSDGYTAQFCGGTLITNSWVLTAAHCTYNETGVAFNAAELDVIIGRHQLSSTQGERIRIDKIVRNRNYDVVTLHNDIALLHLSQPSTGTPVRLVAPVRNDLERATIKATVTGWGTTANGEATDKLQQAELPIVSATTCHTVYAKIGLNLSPDILCAGYAEGGIDACTGDSGGPLVVWDAQTQNWVQIGIVSWGEGCAQQGLFGVYTRVANFTNWIIATTHIEPGGEIISSLNVTQGS
jgi:secreted trypsin-like serine protease